MKRILALFLSLLITFIFYRPIFYQIPLSNDYKGDYFDPFSKISKDLNVPVNKFLNGVLGSQLGGVIDSRHNICLINKNEFYLYHVDSLGNGEIKFKTNNLVGTNYGDENRVGAMAAKIYYGNSNSFDEVYREPNQQVKCTALYDSHLKEYQKAEIEYRFNTAAALEEIETDAGKIQKVLRQVVGGYEIDTKNSSLFIIASPAPLIATFVVLFLLLGSLFENFEKLRREIWMGIQKIKNLVVKYKK